MTIAYLAQGRLYVRDQTGKVQEIHSDFVERANERARQTSERHGWKRRDGDPGEMFPAGLIWHSQRNAARLDNMKINGVTRGTSNELLFALQTDTIGGLFAHDPAQKSERRLYHKQQFRPMQLTKHPTEDAVALSIASMDMSAHLAITDTEGRRLREITEGDSIDEAPSWCPGEGKKLVFQSAGIARGRTMPVVGPYRVEELDLDRGSMNTLVEDDRYDHLNPHMATDGSLYFIRRPWTPNQLHVPMWRIALDALLFPFRLARAFVHFFNFFSVAFSGKPLITSGGPQQQPQNSTSLMLWGKLVNAEKAMKSTSQDNAPSLVPSSWQLIRRTPDENETVVANGVVSFDLDRDGSIVFTNGSGIFRQMPGAESELICKDKLIDQVRVIAD